MWDILSNHRVERLRSVADKTVGAETLPSTNGIDTMASGTGLLQYQRPQRALFIVDVTNVNSTGKLDLVFADSPTKSVWDTDWVTVAQIGAAGLYLIDLVDFNRYIRCVATVASATVTWGAYLVTFDDRWKPVAQNAATVIPALTYGSGRSGKVAAP